jgi:hypothetical protein
LRELIPIILAIYGVLCCFFLIGWKLHYFKEYTKYYYSFYTFFEYSVFSFLFWLNIKQKKIKLFILIASFFFLTFQLIYLFTFKIDKLDSYSIGIEAILLFIYIFFFFYESSKNIIDNYIYNHYCFWIAVGILLYLGGSFFFYILIDHLDEDQVKIFGNLTYVAEILKNLMFTLAIVLYSRRPDKSIKPKSIPHLDMTF